VIYDATIVLVGDLQTGNVRHFALPKVRGFHRSWPRFVRRVGEVDGNLIIASGDGRPENEESVELVLEADDKWTIGLGEARDGLLPSTLKHYYTALFPPNKNAV
jgi:hypothetical protein